MKKDTIIENECPVHVTIGIISGKWKMAILWNLRNGVRRFGELRHAIGEVTAAMLTNQLRELEEDGVVSRVTYAEVPPRVEYSLTPLGQSLVPVIVMMERWGLDYLQEKGHPERDCLWGST